MILPGDFRMIPRQSPYPDKPHGRYGIWIKNHPRGDPDHGGLYHASWLTYDEACMAAISVGLDWHDVIESSYLPASEFRRDDS